MSPWSQFAMMGQNPLAGVVPPPPGKPFTSNTKTTGTVNDQSKNSYMSPEEFKAMTDEVNSIPARQDQKAGIDQMQDMFNKNVDMQKGMSHVDLTPLMKLADAWSLHNKNMTGGYNPPEQPQDTVSKLQNYMAQIQGQKAAFGNQTVQDVKDLINGKNQSKQMDIYKQMLMSGQNPQLGSKNLLGWNQSWQKQSTPISAALKSANDVSDLLNKNTSLSDLAAKIATLRASGLSRITNFEIGAMSGDQAASQRMEQMLQKFDTGNFTEANRKELQDVVNTYKASAEKAMQNVISQYRTLSSGLGIDPAISENMMKGSMPTAPQGPDPAMAAKAAKYQQYLKTGGKPIPQAETDLKAAGVM